MIDGLVGEHLAVLCYDGDPYSSTSSPKVAVFRIYGDTLRLVGESNAWYGHERNFWSVRIQDGAVSLRIARTGGCCEYSSTDFRFKARNGTLRLVGVEDDISAMSNEGRGPGENPIAYERRVSTNHLVGRRVYSQRAGRSTIDEPFAIAGPAKDEEHEVLFQPVLIELAGFDPYDYVDLVIDKLRLCSYFDSSGVFRTCSSQ